MPSMLTPGGLRDLVNAMNLDEKQKSIFMEFARGAGLIDERVAFAMRQLDLKTERATICKGLMALYTVSERTAYRLIEQALKDRQISAIQMAENQD